jgi:hypothetical protein
MGTLQYDAAPASQPTRLGFWNVLWRVAAGMIVAALSVEALQWVADRLGVVARPPTGFPPGSLFDLPFAANGTWSQIADAAAWGLAGCVVTLVLVATLTLGTGLRVGAARVALVVLIAGPYLVPLGHPAAPGRVTFAWVAASAFIWRFAFVPEAWSFRRQAVVIAASSGVLFAVVAPYGVTHPVTLLSLTPSTTRVAAGTVVRPLFELRNAGFADMRVTGMGLTEPSPFAVAPSSASEGFSLSGHSSAIVGLTLHVRGCTAGDHWPLDRLRVDYRVLGFRANETVMLSRPLLYRCR